MIRSSQPFLGSPGSGSADFLLTGDWHQADELAQDAMARTYTAWGRLRRRDRAAAVERPASTVRGRNGNICAAQQIRELGCVGHRLVPVQLSRRH
jgi:hypothetical protein